MGVMAERRSMWVAGMYVYMQAAAPILAAAIVLPLIGRLYLAAYEGTAPVGQAVAAIVIEALPALMLAWAVFGLVRVLSEYVQGRFVSLRASSGLQIAGTGVTFGLLLHVVMMPLGLAILNEQPLWPALDADMFDVALLMFAAGMVAIGGALEAAVRNLQSENDQIV